MTANPIISRFLFVVQLPYLTIITSLLNIHLPDRCKEGFVIKFTSRHICKDNNQIIKTTVQIMRDHWSRAMGTFYRCIGVITYEGCRENTEKGS